MLYKTHKAAGVLTCLIAFDILRNRGALAPDINQWVQLAIVYPACSWASTAPDLDHALCNVKEQTPINILINKVLHLGSCTHRSVQTHSICFTGGFCILLHFLCYWLSSWLNLDANSEAILQLFSLGVTLGIASHLIMDSLSTAGIWLIPNVKFRLVPATKMFATGGLWEKIWQWLLLLAVAYMGVHLVIAFSGHQVIVGNSVVL